MEKGRPDDLEHTQALVNSVQEYAERYDLEASVFIPVAMLHDCGHSAILPEHFKYITGSEKVSNGKLVHMLTGAKIAHDFLQELNYDQIKIQEIVEIISTHDFDQLNGADLEKVYNSENKRLFHDLDSLDRYTPLRLKNALSRYSSKEQLLSLLEKELVHFFHPELRRVAENNLEQLRSE